MIIVYDIETVTDEAYLEGEFPPIYAHKVIAIAYTEFTDTYKVRESGIVNGPLLPTTEQEEFACVETFLMKARGKTIIDWNGRRFDFPVLQSRAFHYGISMGWYFGDRDYNNRYGDAHIDLSDRWRRYGTTAAQPLGAMAELMGVPGKTGMKGSQVQEVFEAGGYDQISSYCMQDVYTTSFVFLRAAYTWGLLDGKKYNDEAKSLFAHVLGKQGFSNYADQIDTERLYVP